MDHHGTVLRASFKLGVGLAIDEEILPHSEGL